MFPEKLTGAEENPQEENPQEENRKGRKRFIEGVEEDPPEENPIFKPADLPHFQDGVDTRQYLPRSVSPRRICDMAHLLRIMRMKHLRKSEAAFSRCTSPEDYPSSSAC